MHPLISQLPLRVKPQQKAAHKDKLQINAVNSYNNRRQDRQILKVRSCNTCLEKTGDKI